MRSLRTGCVTYAIIQGSFGFVCLMFVYKFQRLVLKNLVQINGLEAELQLREKLYPSLCIFTLKEMKFDFVLSDAVWEDRGHKNESCTLLHFLSFLLHFFTFFSLFFSSSFREHVTICCQCSVSSVYFLLPVFIRLSHILSQKFTNVFTRDHHVTLARLGSL
jgi:hypothetical protein